jgi:hypothetical protein
MATLTSTDGILVTYSDEFGSHQVPLGAVLLAALQDVAVNAPNNGDVLTFNAAAKQWLNQAASGGSVVVRKRVSAGTIGSALISLPISINWATPFADQNYTVIGGVEIGEATSDGAVTSIINLASLEKLANGAGVIVTVANADSIPHSCTVHLMAVHD